MMDPQLAEHVASISPKLNPVLANGLATVYMPYAEQYLLQVFHTIQKTYPEGLVFKGSRRCTPQEEYVESIHPRKARLGGKRQSRYTLEMARSDLYLVRYDFEYFGVPLKPIYIFLPFVGQGGRITLAGSQFVISPTLSDRVFSIGENSIFVRLIRDKLTVKRRIGHHRTNILVLDSGRTVPVPHLETVQFTYSSIHHKQSAKSKNSSAKGPSTRPETCLTHYLFCKYGVKETFRRFAKCDIGMGTTISEEQYPAPEWVICSTAGTPPPFVGKAPYRPTQIKLAIPVSAYTPKVKAMVDAFFYVVDHFPDMFEIKPGEEHLVDDFRKWRSVLGMIISGPDTLFIKLLTEMDNHIESLDDYIDEIMRAKLRLLGLEINDFYEFCDLINENFNKWILNNADKVHSMHDKELSILYNVLIDITSEIFKSAYKIKATASTKKPLTAIEIETILHKHLKKGLIYSLRNTHPEVSTIAYSGDNQVFKVTTTIVPQSSTGGRGGKRGGKRGSIGDPTQRLHTSVAEFASYSAMPKRDPSGRGRLNPFAKIDSNGTLVRNEQFVSLMDETQKQITIK